MMSLKAALELLHRMCARRSGPEGVRFGRPGVSRGPSWDVGDPQIPDAIAAAAVGLCQDLTHAAQRNTWRIPLSGVARLKRVAYRDQGPGKRARRPRIALQTRRHAACTRVRRGNTAPDGWPHKWTCRHRHCTADYQWGNSRAGFESQDVTGPVVASGPDHGVRRDRSQPKYSRIVGQWASALNDEMTIDILLPFRSSVAFNVGTARIQGPATLGNLATNERFVFGLAGPDCYIGLPLG
jgi:hypothetical protein